MQTATLRTEEMAEFKKLLTEGLKELSELRRKNQKLNAEIARLRASTRKTLDRIGQELEYVQAAR
jgi:hypothetical protein